ncbi:hypothetical protein [Aeromonas rivipollensis]|uniref:hypothetical protein n=1 Tax=Aeromonas rivipollensis TaxID=948519 RepID=UPI0030CB7CAB
MRWSPSATWSRAAAATEADAAIYDAYKKGAIGSLFNQQCQPPKPIPFLHAPLIWLVAIFAAYPLVFAVVAIGNLVKGRCCN